MVTLNLECYARMLRTKQFQRTLLMNGEMAPGWRVAMARMTVQGVRVAVSIAITVPIGVGGEGDFLEISGTYYVIERVAFHTLSSFGDGTLALGLLASWSLGSAVSALAKSGHWLRKALPPPIKT